MKIQKKIKPKIIIYELNEVPRRILDLYIQKNPRSAFAEIAREGIILNTLTKDNGELHPWSTWPTVHRGVNNFIHNIRFINQDLTPSKQYMPIWEILAKNEIDVGIFGSLQSFPPLDGKNYKFYIPDTFAPSPEAYPKDLSDFQKFNLNLTNENKAISRSFSKENLKDLLYLIANGVLSKSSLVKLLKHVIKEKLNSKYKTRRSTMQNVLSFPIYLKYLHEYQPTFSTYFTNHVAGMMHRYWKDLFPSDLSLDKKDIDKFHSKTILKAMDLADNNLRHLIKFVKKTDYQFFVISSMGQASIDYGIYKPEFQIRDFQKFLSGLGLNKNNYKLYPAMQPDFSIECKNEDSMEQIRNAINNLKDSESKNIIVENYAPVGLRVTFAMGRSRSMDKTKKCFLNGKILKINRLGIEPIKRDKGTAYHTSEGIFCSYGRGIDEKSIKSDEIIDTCRICPTILNLYGIDIPDYMQKPFF